MISELYLVIQTAFGPSKNLNVFYSIHVFYLTGKSILIPHFQFLFDRYVAATLIRPGETHFATIDQNSLLQIFYMRGKQEVWSYQMPVRYTLSLRYKGCDLGGTAVRFFLHVHELYFCCKCYLGKRQHEIIRYMTISHFGYFT